MLSRMSTEEVAAGPAHQACDGIWEEKKRLNTLTTLRNLFKVKHSF